MKKGKVYLVGAGPGDIGLLTVKGRRCLERADVVVYDFHVNAQVLNYVRHEAEFIYAGKRRSHHAMAQEEINRALVEKAKEGKIICRLKGGDPFIFGRGGEEAEALAREGIEFEVVPGVSSVVAAPASAGIPLTHRGYASSFSVVTGNEAANKTRSSLFWDGLARGSDTIVFLMAVSNVEAIGRQLIEAGRHPDTPVAMIRWGTRPDQRTIVGTLATIARLVEDSHFRAPAVMVVGEVVTLRSVLQWYERKPLFGHRILITGQYGPQFEPLEELGAEIFEFPTTRIEPPVSYGPLDRAIDGIARYRWLVFATAESVRTFLGRYLGKGQDIRDLKGIRLCAVTAGAEEAIRACGMKADLSRDTINPGEVVEAMIGLSRGGSIDNVLVPRQEQTLDGLVEALRSVGAGVDAPDAYRVVKRRQHARRLRRFLLEGRITIAVFTSGDDFTAFLEVAGSDALPLLRNVLIAASHPLAVTAIEKAGLEVSIRPERSDIGAMVSAIVGRMAPDPIER